MVEGRQFWKTQSELVSQTWLSPSTKNAGLHQCKCLKLWRINTTTIYQTESLIIIKKENMNEKSNFSLLKNENWKFDKKICWVNCFLFLFFFSRQKSLGPIFLIVGGPKGFLDKFLLFLEQKILEPKFHLQIFCKL